MNTIKILLVYRQRHPIPIALNLQIEIGLRHINTTGSKLCPITNNRHHVLRKVSQCFFSQP